MARHDLFDENDLRWANETLSTIPFYPQDGGTQSAISDFLAKVCPHRTALRWVVTTLAEQKQPWPGLGGIRELLCKRFAPADGVEFGDLGSSEGDDIDCTQFPNHEQERLIPPPELTVSRTLQIAGDVAPPMPADELEKLQNETLGPLIEKRWPRGLKTSHASETRKLEEQLAADAAAAPKLTEEQKQSRLAELEEALAARARIPR
jgi:hypothetical protein